MHDNMDSKCSRRRSASALLMSSTKVPYRTQPLALLLAACLILSAPAFTTAACINSYNVCDGAGPDRRPIGGCGSYALCDGDEVVQIVSCGIGNIYDVLLERCNWENNSFCVVDSCPPTPWPSSMPSASPSGSPSGSPSASPSASPSSAPSGSPTAMPSSDPSSAPSALPTINYEFFEISELETEYMRQRIESMVLQSFNPAGIAYPSKLYSYEGLMKSLKEMSLEGITSGGRTFRFYISNKEKRLEYGMTNLALFLAMAMTETIAVDTCDEFNIDDVADRYPLSNACGQNNRSYQDEVCTGSDERMSCPVDLGMEIVSSGYSSGSGMSGRAPPPFYCGPKANFHDYAGYWDRLSGASSNTAYSNARGRSDVEGCCWWGRGALLTRGVCNIGKLNYYLGKRAYDERGEGKFPTVDFCASPEATCASEEGYEEIRWITGFFEWVERIQSYPDWDYIDNLKKYVDEGMEDDSFIDTVSSIFTRGCHLPDCSYMEVTMREQRRDNLKKVLRTFELPKVETPTTLSPTTLPTPKPLNAPPFFIQPPSLSVSQPGQPIAPPNYQNTKPTVRPTIFANENPASLGVSQPMPTIMTPPNENNAVGPTLSDENGAVGSAPFNENAAILPTKPTIFAPSNENSAGGTTQSATPTVTTPIYSETGTPARTEPGNLPTNDELIAVEDNLAYSLVISLWTILLTIFTCAMQF